MTESFWTISDTTNLPTPVTIMKEQAEALTQGTKIGVLKTLIALSQVGLNVVSKPG